MAGYKQIKPRFKKGEVANPNGRPRKLVSHFLKEFKAMGLEPVTSEQIKGMIENLLNQDKAGLDRVATDEGAPVGLRLLARYIIKADNKEQILEFLLSRAHGKANQTIDITSAGLKLDFKNLTDKELLEIRQKLDK